MPIRKAAPEDASAIARIHIQSWQTAYQNHIPKQALEHSEETLVQQWATHLNKNDTTVLVAEIDHQLIGFISFGLTSDKDVDANRVAEIRNIYLDPKYYRCGYGRSLCEAAINQLRADGYSSVTLWVLDDYTPAISFYQALGFQKTDDVKIDNKSTVELKTRRFSRSL